MKLVCRDCKGRIKELYRPVSGMTEQSFTTNPRASMMSTMSASVAVNREDNKGCKGCEIF